MKFRDVELLSAYLDGQLDPSDSARIESRLRSDPGLRSVMDDIRAARGLLRQLPARKAPRDFRLTRKMVGLNPPMPRAYPFLRFASAFAALLFALSFAVNGLAPGAAFQAAAPAPVGGMGGGYGGGAPEAPAVTGMPATEPPQEMAVPATAIPPAASEPSVEMLGPVTEMPPAADESSRAAETPVYKGAEGETFTQAQPEIQRRAPISSTWQAVLLAVVLFSGLGAFLLRFSSLRKWRGTMK